jgi:hypothetical protein
MIHGMKDTDWSKYKHIFEFICLFISIYFIYQFFSGNMIGFAGLIGFGYHRIHIDGWSWIVNRGGLYKPIVTN